MVTKKATKKKTAPKKVIKKAEDFEDIGQLIMKRIGDEMKNAPAGQPAAGTAFNWCWPGHKKKRFSGFGFMLLIIGLFWLAKELGWIILDISIWPIVLIVIGLWFLFDKLLG